MKPIHLLMGSVALAATVLIAPNATAKNAYRIAAIEQLKLTPDKGGKQTITCQYCHTAAFGGEGWNAFGDALDAKYEGVARKNVGQMLYLTLKDNKDSDGDGYTDALEVFSKTLPGDAKSKPIQSVIVIKAAFSKAGGVNQYKPKM